MRGVSKLSHGGGRNKEERVRAAAGSYLEDSERLEAKVFQTWQALREEPLEWAEIVQLSQLEYFHTALIGQFVLLERRLLRADTIPYREKYFSLFVPHTHWFTNGRLLSHLQLLSP